MNKQHEHRFSYANNFFDFDRQTPGEILRCKCGAECFRTKVGNKTYNSYCKNGKEYFNKTETTVLDLQKNE